ncbi:MAG: radical SAM protein [Candidatus Aenigmarchaeota archaeon]|nr:radical SAM protein [Candidatus Aenigmarchaeota archaeon]
MKELKTIFDLSVNLPKSMILHKPVVMSFDVTNRCNLKCPMCYWWTRRAKREMTLEEIITLFKELRKKGIIQCTYVGGEPTLRPDVLEECTRIIPYNWIVTNGSHKIPNLKNSILILSLDGSKEIHDRIREKGLYDVVFERFSTRKGIITTTTLFRWNRNEPEKLLKDWSNTNIAGMTFNFVTPFTDSDNEFCLKWEERDRTIDRLLKLKREYKDFLLLSKQQLLSLKKKNVPKWSRDCIVKWFSICIASDGSLLRPCVLGKHAICSECGCHVPAMINSIYRLDIKGLMPFVRFRDITQ